jgi:uncharacterized damage-inducible protein DinB
MIQENITVSISIESWQGYQNLLKQAVAPLTDEQLAFRMGTQRSAGELVAHIVAVRAWYLHGIMGEGGAEIESLRSWDDAGAPPRTSAELLIGIDQTWQLLTSCLAHWSAAEMNDVFFLNWRGRDETRGWIIWHLIEHEIHHGGELSFTLGSFGLPGVAV